MRQQFFDLNTTLITINGHLIKESEVFFERNAQQISQQISQQGGNQTWI